MGWLRPEDIRDSGPMPDEQNREFREKHGEIGSVVLNAFEDVNPASFYYIEGDEYLGEAKRFIEQVADKELEKMTVDEVEELIKSSISPFRIASGGVRMDSLNNIARTILGHYKHQEEY